MAWVVPVWAKLVLRVSMERQEEEHRPALADSNADGTAGADSTNRPAAGAASADTVTAANAAAAAVTALAEDPNSEKAMGTGLSDALLSSPKKLIFNF